MLNFSVLRPIKESIHSEGESVKVTELISQKFVTNLQFPWAVATFIARDMDNLKIELSWHLLRAASQPKLK